jgi:hypothetical protein
MPKKQVSKARMKAMTRYQKKNKMQGPLTEAQENAAYEQDMRRRSGAKDPGQKFADHHKPQRRVKNK